MIPPTPTPSPTPAIIQTVSIATGSRESLHRLPLPASVLDAPALQAIPATTGDAALRVIPGFDRDRSNSGFTNYGQLRVSFGGTGNDRGVVLVDGVPAQDGFGGQIDWAAYPAQDLRRAELLRGPGSALYGSGAMGGVLSLQASAPPTTASASDALLSLGFGSHAESNAYLNVGKTITPNLGASFAMQQSSMQYDDLAPGYQAPIDRDAQSRQSMASLRFRFAPTPETVFDYGYRAATDYQQEGRPNYDFWRNLAQQSLGMTHTTQRSQTTLRFYQRNAMVTNQADKYPSAPGTLLYTQLVPTHESGVIGTWTLGSGPSAFEVRANMRFVNGVSTQANAAGVFTSGGSGVQTLGDLAAQETIVGERDELVVGLSGSEINLVNAALFKPPTMTTVPPRTDRALSPRVALRHDLSKHLAFRASAGTGFRAPYLNELVRGYVIGPVTYNPNPNLATERNSSMIAGFDWLGARDELALDATRTFVTNAIDFATISPTVQMRSNFSHTQTDGMTVVLRHRFSACDALSVSGTKQYARITAGTPAELGMQLPYVPKAVASAAYATRIGVADVGVDLSYSGVTFADDLNAQPLGTATTVGASLALPIGEHARLKILADNITDAHYLSSTDRYAPPSVLSVNVVWKEHPNEGCEALER